MNFGDFKGLTNPKVLRFSKKEVALPGDPSERWQEDYQNALTRFSNSPLFGTGLGTFALFKGNLISSKLFTSSITHAFIKQNGFFYEHPPR